MADNAWRWVETGHVPTVGNFENALVGGWFIIAMTLWAAWKQRYPLLAAGALPFALIILGGFVLHPRGEIDRAEMVTKQGIVRVHERSMEVWARTGLLILGRIAANRGRWKDAARLFGGCRPNLPPWAQHRRWWNYVATVRAALGAEHYDAIAAAAAAGSVVASFLFFGSLLLVLLLLVLMLPPLLHFMGLASPDARGGAPFRGLLLSSSCSCCIDINSRC